MPNWTGVVCRVQRGALADERVLKHETLKRPSVYILIGADAVSLRPRVYVGQSVQPAQRLRDHLAKKDFWDTALVITTNEDPHCALGATELNYLENCLWDLVAAGVNTVDNDQTPRAGSLTLEEIDVLEEFVERARLIVATLGYRIFEPAGVPLVPLYTMVCKFADGRRFEAQLRENEEVPPKQEERFTVLKGSMIALPLCGQPSLYKRDRALRLQAPVDAQGKLQRDVSFKSASAAARYVVGCPVSGNKYWRMHGKTLGEIRRMRCSSPTAGC